MMNSLANKIYTTLSFLLVVVLIFSCTKMDHHYEDFIQGGERTYPGKVFEVEAMPGNNRIKLGMKMFPDPNVKNVWVKWSANGKKDSLQTDLTQGSSYHVAEILLSDLPENNYTFYITTADEEGNRSVPTEFNAQVFGDSYQQTLRSAFVQEASFMDGMLSVTVSPLSDTVAVGSEFSYENAEGVSTKVFVPAETTSFQVEDYKLGSEFAVRSLYIPQRNAIDTFYTDLSKVSVKADITEVYLANTGFPFTNTGTLDANRWGILTDWTTNDAAKSHNGYGGWESSGGGMMNLESGWGSPLIRNGKIYQTVTLPAGTYSFEVAEHDWMGNMDVAYLVAAEGETLPDVDVVPAEALAYASLKTLKIRFTLAEEKAVSLGIVVDFFNEQGQGFKIKRMKLSSE